MIEKLRLRFILLSIVGLLILLLVIISASGLVSFRQLADDADAIIDSLTADQGFFFAKKDHRGDRDHIVTPETPYESRYFCVILTKSGNPYSVQTDNIVSVTDTEAVAYAQAAAARSSAKGFIENFRYNVYESTYTTSVVFLDYTRSIVTFRSSLLSTALLSLLGLAVVSVFIIAFSDRIVRPVAESYDKQRKFITAAGHEIRTPLTIIDADTEILEMDLEDSEWLRDIRTQTRRLAGLTNDLIRLSRMDEGSEHFRMLDFPLSDIVAETARSFQPVAAGRGLTMECRVEPGLSLCGDESAIRQLVSIFLDNAIKYAADDTGEPIRLTLERRAQAVWLTVTNAACPVTQEQLRQFFDRFYRTEQSRNSEKGGYGLGLSIAKAIVDAHKGKITASAPDENHVQISACLPIKRS